jgi:hypothetical protein
MFGEDALLEAAGGDFNLVLIAVLVIGLVGSFIWALKMIIAQNQRFQDCILHKFDLLVDTLKDYKCDTEDRLNEHDKQAKEIKTTAERIETNLRARPCMRDDRR